MSTEVPSVEVNANDVVAFVIEIGVLVLLAVAGWQTGTSTLTSWVLAIGLPLVAAVLWWLGSWCYRLCGPACGRSSRSRTPS